MRSPRLRTAVLAASLAGCGTLRSVATAALSPFAAVVSPSSDCEEQPHRVPPPRDRDVVRKLRVGTWNLHYLGPSDERPQEDRDPRDLAAYVRLSGVDVLALQEVGVLPGARGSPTLDAVFAELRRDGADWVYLLWASADDLSQATGLAWNRRVAQGVGEPYVLAVDGDPPGIVPFVPLPVATPLWSRRPFAVKLSAGPGLTDVVFVPVHLTARVEMLPLEDATAHREEEARVLVERLGDVAAHFRDRDVVVLGDFNTELSTEHVTDALAERGWRDLNCAGATTHHLGMSLDRIFVPDTQPEFALQPNLANVEPEPDFSWLEFLGRYSDHVMIAADVLVLRDDD